MTHNLVTLRAGTGHSFAFVHPASGLITAFRRLVPHLSGHGATTLWTPGTHYDLLSDEHAPYLAGVLSTVLTLLDEPSLSFGGAAT